MLQECQTWALIKEYQMGWSESRSKGFISNKPTILVVGMKIVLFSELYGSEEITFAPLMKDIDSYLITGT